MSKDYKKLPTTEDDFFEASTSKKGSTKKQNKWKKVKKAAIEVCDFLFRGVIPDDGNEAAYYSAVYFFGYWP